MKPHLQYFFYESMFSPRVRETKRYEIEHTVYEQVAVILADNDKLKRYLPLCPNTLLELLKALSDPDADIGNIEAVIHREPVLAVKIISTANAPLYRGDKPKVDNVVDAINRVGIDGLNNIAKTYLLQDTMTVNLDNYQMFGKTIWEHSLHVAFLCRDLAGKRGDIDPELCYLMGLVHDIGKIVIFNVLSEAYNEQSREFLPCSRRFIELMTDKSALITERILEDWHFDRTIVEAIKRQQHKNKPPMAQILFVANLLSESYIMIANGCFEGQDGIDQLVRHHGVEQSFIDGFFSVADTIADARQH